MGKNASDGALWQAEYRRQLLSIKAALHSLKLQTDQRRNEKPVSRAVKQMAHQFEMVDIAFKALNTPDPEDNVDPGVILGPKGRREFLSDLKAGQ